MAMMSAVRSSIVSRTPLVLPPRKGQRRGTMAISSTRDGSRPWLIHDAASTRMLGDRVSPPHARRILGSQTSSTLRHRGDLVGADADDDHHRHRSLPQESLRSQIPTTSAQYHEGRATFSRVPGSRSKAGTGPDGHSTDNNQLSHLSRDEPPRGRARGGSDAGIRTVPPLRIGRDRSPARSEERSAAARGSIRGAAPDDLTWQNRRALIGTGIPGHDTHRIVAESGASDDLRALQHVSCSRRQPDSQLPYRCNGDTPPPMTDTSRQTQTLLAFQAQGQAGGHKPSAPARDGADHSMHFLASGRREGGTAQGFSAAVMHAGLNEGAGTASSPTRPDDIDGQTSWHSHEGDRWTSELAGGSVSAEAQVAYYRGLAMQQQAVIAMQQQQLNAQMHANDASAFSGIGRPGIQRRHTAAGGAHVPMRRVKTMSDAQTALSGLVGGGGGGPSQRAAGPAPASKGAGRFVGAARAVVAAQRFAAGGGRPSLRRIVIPGPGDTASQPAGRPVAVSSGTRAGNIMAPSPLVRSNDSASNSSTGSLLGTQPSSDLLLSPHPGSPVRPLKRPTASQSGACGDTASKGHGPAPAGDGKSAARSNSGVSKGAEEGGFSPDVGVAGGGDGWPEHGASSRLRMQSTRSVTTTARIDDFEPRSQWAKWASETPCLPVSRSACHSLYKMLSLTDSIIGTVFSNLIMLAIITSVVVMCIESTREVREARLRGEAVPVLSELELLAVVLFTFELLGRVISATSTPLIDLYGGNTEDDDEEEEDFDGDEEQDDTTFGVAQQDDVAGPSSPGGSMGKDTDPTDSSSASRLGVEGVVPSSSAVASVAREQPDHRPSATESNGTVDTIATKLATTAGRGVLRRAASGTLQPAPGQTLMRGASAGVGSRPATKAASMYKIQSRSIDGVNTVLAERRQISQLEDDDDETDDDDQLRDLELSRMPVERLEASLARRLSRAKTPGQRTEAWAQYRRRLGLRGRRDTWCTWWCGALQRTLCPCCLDVPCKPGTSCRSVWSVTCSPRARLKLWVFFTSSMNLIDVAAIVPYYVELLMVAWGASEASNSGVGLAVLRVLRVARVLRVLKLGKRSAGATIIARSMEKSGQALILTLFFVAMGIILFGALLFYAESGEYDVVTGKWMRADVVGTDLEETPFHSIMASFWFCIVSATTSGYGDMYPTSFIGKVVASALQLAGIVVLALPISIIGSNFTTVFREYQGIRGWRRLGYSTKQAKQLVAAGRFPEDVTPEAILAAEAEGNDTALMLGADGVGPYPGAWPGPGSDCSLTPGSDMGRVDPWTGQHQPRNDAFAPGLHQLPYWPSYQTHDSSGALQPAPLSSGESRTSGVRFPFSQVDPLSALPGVWTPQLASVAEGIVPASPLSLVSTEEAEPRIRFSVDRRLGTLVSSDGDDDSERNTESVVPGQATSTTTLPQAAGVGSSTAGAPASACGDSRDALAEDDDSVGSSRVSEVKDSDVGDLGHRPRPDNSQPPGRSEGSASRAAAQVTPASADVDVPVVQTLGGTGRSFRVTALQGSSPSGDELTAAGTCPISSPPGRGTGVVMIPASIGGASVELDGGLAHQATSVHAQDEATGADSGCGTPDDVTDVSAACDTADAQPLGSVSGLQGEVAAKHTRFQSLHTDISTEDDPVLPRSKSVAAARAPPPAPARSANSFTSPGTPRSPPPAPPRNSPDPGIDVIQHAKPVGGGSAESLSHLPRPPPPPPRSAPGKQSAANATQKPRATHLASQTSRGAQPRDTYGGNLGVSDHVIAAEPIATDMAAAHRASASQFDSSSQVASAEEARRRVQARRASMPLLGDRTTSGMRKQVDGGTIPTDSATEHKQLVAIVVALQSKLEEMSQNLKVLAAQSLPKHEQRGAARQGAQASSAEALE